MGSLHRLFSIKLTLLVPLCVGLAACGTKPKLKDLEVPKKKAGIVLEEPVAAAEIDGVVDGPAP
ncbi:MAG: hypothetical protein AAFY06_12375, partial [Pseudomonadota bacterium]